MKIKLIDYTGAESPDEWYAARKLIIAKNTRLAKGIDIFAKVAAMNEDQLKDELLYISNTIRSSWEFVDYTFKVSGISRACCDQMTRTRVGASFAVMTQRTVDQSDFDYVIPDTIQKSGLIDVYKEHMKDNAAFYAFLIKAGIPTQDARSVLPMATESPLTVQYNLRTFADLVGKRENLRAQGEYASVVREMACEVMSVHPWTSSFLYPERKSTPKLDAFLKSLVGTATPSGEIADALKELDKVKGTWG